MPKIEVPDKSYDRLADRAQEKGFESPDNYVNSVLKQVVDKIERKKKRQERKTYSKEEEEKVKNRLRGLGYLD